MQKAIVIDRKVTVEKIEQATINVPAFFRNDNAYYQVLSSDELIEIQIYFHGYFLMHRNNAERDVITACSYQAIDHAEFLQAAQKMLYKHNSTMEVIMQDAPLFDLELEKLLKDEIKDK